MQARSRKLIIKVGTFYLLETENDAKLPDPSLLLASKLHRHLFLPLKHIKSSHSNFQMLNGGWVIREDVYDDGGCKWGMEMELNGV